VIGVAGWLREDRTAAEAYEEAMRADTLRHEMQRHLAAVDRALAEARKRVSGLTDTRNLGVLRRQLIRQPLYTTVPAGVTHGEWVAALEHALHAQFAGK
jgi:hypothetical protein